MRRVAVYFLLGLSTTWLGCAREGESESRWHPEVASEQGLDPSRMGMTVVGGENESPTDVRLPSTRGKTPAAISVDAPEALRSLDPRFAVSPKKENTGSRLDPGIKSFRAGKFAEAARDFEAVIGSDPDNPWAHYFLGLTVLEMGKAARSVPHLDTALRLSPEFREAYLARGVARLQERWYDKAEADFSEAIRLGQADARVYVQRGTCRLNQGDFEAAREDATRALEIGPESAEAYFIRCIAHARLSQKEKAKADYAKAVELGLADNLAEIARSYLR